MNYGSGVEWAKGLINKYENSSLQLGENRTGKWIEFHIKSILKNDSNLISGLCCVSDSMNNGCYWNDNINDKMGNHVHDYLSRNGIKPNQNTNKSIIIIGRY